MTRPNTLNAVTVEASALLQTYRVISVIEHAIEQGKSPEAHCPSIRSLASFLRLVGTTLLSSTTGAPAQAIQNAQEELNRIGPDPRMLTPACLWTLLNAVHLLPITPDAGADLLVFLGFALDRLTDFEADQQVPVPSLFRFKPLESTDRLLYQTLHAAACSLPTPPTMLSATPDVQAWTDLRSLWESVSTALPNFSAITFTLSQQHQVQSIRLHLSSGTAPALAAVEICRHLNDDWKKDPLARFWAEALVQALGTLRIQAPKVTTFKFFPGMDGGST